MRYGIVLLFVFVWFCINPAKGQLVKHSYRFYENFAVAQPECGPDLKPEKALGTCIADDAAGEYVVDALPCGVQRKVYHTNLNWGLVYPNQTGAITDTYTIQMYIKVTDWGKTWARIIDFSNGQLDQGIYFKDQNGSKDKCINFYPAGNAGPCPYFNNSTYYFLTFTRNGKTGIVDVYVDNVLFTSYNDAQNLYVGKAGTPIYIFRDDSRVPCESGAANFAYLSFNNQYSLQKDVDDIYSQICFVANINATADFSIDPNPSCGISKDIAIAYTGEIPVPGDGYTFDWDWGAATVVSGTGMGPYVIRWNSMGIKKITLTITNIACGNKIVNTKETIIGSLDLTTTVTNTSCNSNDATITVTAVDGASPYEYSIDSVNYQTDQIFKVVPAVYTVYVKDANKCISSKKVEIVATDAVTVKTIDDVSICKGEQIQLLTTSNADTFFWSPSTALDDAVSKDPIATPASFTEYIVTATKDNCSSKDTVRVTVIPEITVNVTPDSEVESATPFQLTASSPELVTETGVTYDWLPPTGLDNSKIENPFATITSNTTYSIKITSKEGCIGTGQVNLTVIATPFISVPTAFTPDGNNINEVLKPVAYGISSLNYFRIYSRWGEVVFSSDQLETGWDGKFQGISQNGGEYVFKLEAVSEKGKTIRKEGSVLLIR